MADVFDDELPLWAQELGGAGLEEQDEFDMLRMRSSRVGSDSGLTDSGPALGDDGVPDWLDDIDNDSNADSGNGSGSSGGSLATFNSFSSGQKLTIAILVFLILLVFAVGLILLFQS